ncbi:MAG: lipopolysaccharide biosynthesis protein, partial [Cyanobacteria bacterium J06639_18]
LIKTLFKPTVASIGAAIAVMGISELLNININTVLSLFLDIVLYTSIYFGIWILLPNGKTTLFEILQLTKNLKGKTKRV